MRKLIGNLLLLIIFITSLSSAFANESSGKILLQEEGKGKNYQVVNLKIDGKTVKSTDVPPIIYPINNQGRTLVPLRMIIEHLQDKLNAEIEWNGLKQEVKIKNEDKEIILKINSPTALVNGVEKRLPDNIPAKLLAIGSNGRTMVPIRFFAEEFGINIIWDEKTVTASLEVPKEPVKKPEQEEESSTGLPGNPLENPPEVEVAHITDVQVIGREAVSEIRVKTSQKVDTNEFKLINPDRLVIDLNNARFNMEDKTRLEANGTLSIKPNSDVIRDIRVAQFQNEPFITRIVMELKKPTEYEISFDEVSGEIVISFNNYVRNVRKEVRNLKEVLVIEGDALEDYVMFQLASPNRLVIDIKGGVLHSRLKNRTINIDSKIVEGVRTSQFDGGNNSPERAVRIVLDLKDLDGYEEFYAELENNQLIVHLEGEPFQSLVYEETTWTTSRLTFKGLRPTEYYVEPIAGTNIIEITVPKRDMDLDFTAIDIQDHIIRRIDVEEDRDYYYIQLELQDSVVYAILSPEESRDLILELNNKDAKYREKLIIIDPGHGGSDPGTISTTLKMYESEIVLDMGLELNRLLTEAGFRTYMTRIDNLNRETKLSLQERTDVANALGADLFVSIHANAAPNATAKGIETYYYPSERNPLDMRDNKKVADIFHRELIDSLNMDDRKVRAEEFYVLKYTTMPSVLVETGFVTNPEDEAKLATREYRTKVAEALFKAIIRYFEETK